MSRLNFEVKPIKELKEVKNMCSNDEQIALINTTFNIFKSMKNN